MSDALKPCPFCGGQVDIEKTIDGRKWYGVVCRNTQNLGGSCAVSIRPSASEESAIGRWNMRAQANPNNQEPLKLLDAIISGMETGFVRCENCGEQEDTSTLDFMSDLKELRVMLAAVNPTDTPPQ